MAKKDKQLRETERQLDEAWAHFGPKIETLVKQAWLAGMQFGLNAIKLGVSDDQ